MQRKQGVEFFYSDKFLDFKEKWFKFTGYSPHNGQVKIHHPDKPARFIVAVCGRRWGKSVCASKR